MIQDQSTAEYVEDSGQISDFSAPRKCSRIRGVSIPPAAVKDGEHPRGVGSVQKTTTDIAKVSRARCHSDCIVDGNEKQVVKRERSRNLHGRNSLLIEELEELFGTPQLNGCNSDRRMLKFIKGSEKYCSKCQMKLADSGIQPRKRNDKKRSFYSVKIFVICLALLQLVQVMGSGYSKSSLTSIERRYSLSTFSIGILQSCFHIGNLSVILFVSYFGSRWNRPRTIAIGSLLMAVSSLLSAMPQFVGSTYNVEASGNIQDTNAPLSAGLYSREAIHDILNSTRNVAAPLLSQHRTSPDNLSGNQNTKPGSLLSPEKSHSKLCNRQIGQGGNSEPESTSQSLSTNEKKPGLTSRGDTGYLLPKIAHLKSEEENFAVNETREKQDSWNDSNLYIFIAVGSVLKGMGHSPLHPLGMSFVDDFATPRNSAVYLGIVSSLSLLGPAFGFILGSWTTGTWVDSGWVDTTKLKIGPHNPLWVGAWWIGYLVTAILLLAATIPFCLFPRDIPKEIEEDEKKDDTDPYFSCFMLCSSYCSKERKNVTFKEESYLSDETKTKCICHSGMTTSKPNSKHNDEGHRRSDEFPFYSKTNGLGYPENISGELDENHAAQLITYLEMPSNGNARFHDEATSCEIPASYSEVKLTPPRSYIMRRSASVHGDEHKRLEEQRKRRSSFLLRNKQKSITDDTEDSRRPSRLDKLALFDFTASLKGLLTDHMFLSITFALVCLTSFLAASVTYISKYMETQFSITASFANLLNGLINLPMAVVGNLLGGWLIRRFNLNVRQTVWVVVTGISMTIVCLGALLFFQCDQGSNVNYFTGAEGGKCAASCNCGDLYYPVCDISYGITYRSPCHAGCTDVISWMKTKVYTGCSCMVSGRSGNETASNLPYNDKIVLRGPCERPDCSKSHLPVFLGVMGTASLTAGLASTPSSLVVLRVVPPAEKAFAIGILFVFTRVLAWIPAPVYVGYVIDAACLRWSDLGGIAYKSDTKTEDKRNHCEIYDKDRLRRNFFAAAGGLLVLSLLFYILALYTHIRRSKTKKKHAKRPQMLGFDSPLMSDKSPERTPTLTYPLRQSQMCVTSNAEERFESNDIFLRTRKDRNCNEFLSQEDEKLLSEFSGSAPYKLTLSVSAPTLATNAIETAIKIPLSNQNENIVRATAV